MKRLRLKWRIRRRPDDAQAWAGLAQCLLDEGDTDGARAAAQSGLDCVSDAPTALHLAGTLQALGMLDRALSAYQAAVELAPEDGEAHVALGRFALTFRRNELACTALARAVALRPGDDQLMAELGEAQLAAGHVTQAVRAFEKVYQRTPGDVDAALRLGRTASRAGEDELAIRVLRTAVMLAPDRLDVRLALTTCVARRGTPEAALQMLQDLRARWQDAPEVLLNIASALAELGRIDAALDALDEAQALRPDQPIIGRNRGAILFGAGRFQEAADAFARLVNRLPENADAHLLHATALHRLHRMTAARNAADRAFALAGEGALKIRARRLRDQLTAPPVVGAEMSDDSISDATLILSGTLDRVPMTQLLEFARTNSTTGSLLISSQDGVADLRLCRGRLLWATCSNQPNLGDRIVDRGWIERSVLADWADRHQASGARLPLGMIMVDAGLLTQRQLEEVLREQMYAVIRTLVTWSRGTFSLLDAEVDDHEHGAALRIDHLLLDVMRMIDEEQAEQR